jgi:signal transduction histidine kinase
LKMERWSSLTLRQGASHRQTRVLLFAGFGGLLLLLGFLGLSAISFLSQIEVREEKIRQDYVSRDGVLQTLRSTIYTSGTHVRDFLLDSNDTRAAEDRRQFLQTRLQIQREIEEYQALIPDAERGPVRELSQGLAAYLDAITPVLDWNASERDARASNFMQDELLPRRVSALSLADRIQQISEGQLQASSAAVSVLLSSFRVKLLALLVLTVLGGSALAGITLWWLLRLEHESQLRFTEVVSTQQELKRLSAELLSAQESERRRISRELHDEVGQVLSAIMLGLGNLRSALCDKNTEEALRQLQQVEDMTQRNASVVRNISLLLRPTMLDDLGLIPALRWLAREVSRTGSMEVDLMAEPFVDDLPDEHRTCVFRIVQEAIRNAARHSGASQVRIYVEERVEENAASLRLSVQDDGKGFDPSQERGLGILGMQERVMRLGGAFEVDSRPGRGTIITFSLPLPSGHQSLSTRREPGENNSDNEFQETRPFRTA